MRNLILTIGMPGSGKSTWAREFLKHNKDYCRVSRDEFRRMLFDVQFDSAVEPAITTASEATWQSLLSDGWNILLDETHLGQWLDRKIRTIDHYCNERHIPYIISRKHFPINFEDACVNNAKRPPHQIVPMEAMERMWANGGEDLWKTRKLKND